MFYFHYLQLTHLCRMYFPIIVNWTSPFPILGLFGGIFHFKRNVCKQTVENLNAALNAASDQVLHCLLMSHKKDAWRVWV